MSQLSDIMSEPGVFNLNGEVFNVPFQINLKNEINYILYLNVGKYSTIA